MDVIDQYQALVDSSEIFRNHVNFKRLSLADITIEIGRNPKKKDLKVATDKADVYGKWENSSWGRKLIVQKKRVSLNNFDRFKVMVARIMRASIIKRELLKLKKEVKA